MKLFRRQTGEYGGLWVRNVLAGMGLLMFLFAVSSLIENPKDWHSYLTGFIGSLIAWRHIKASDDAHDYDDNLLEVNRMDDEKQRSLFQENPIRLIEYFLDAEQEIDEADYGARFLNCLMVTLICLDVWDVKIVEDVEGNRIECPAIPELEKASRSSLLMLSKPIDFGIKCADFEIRQGIEEYEGEIQVFYANRPYTIRTNLKRKRNSRTLTCHIEPYASHSHQAERDPISEA